MNITLAQLEYIVAVDTHRHFVTAAEKCFVTQPTLSMQIKKLEDLLGVIIFDRSKQPIEPTAAGEAIIAQSREVLSNARMIDDIVMSFKEKISGELRVGVIPTIAPYLLPYFVGRFINKHPKIKLKVNELQTHKILEGLKRDTIDLGLLVTPISNPDIHEIPIYYEEFKMYVNKKHPFINREYVDFESINPKELWLLSEGHCFRNQVINLCTATEGFGEHGNFQFEGGSLDTLKQIVDTEGGATLLPTLACKEIEKNTPERLKSIGKVHPFREVSLVYRKGFTKMKLLNLLTDTLKTSLPQEMLTLKQGEIIEWETKKK
ncbi:MAG: LysR substrate-binding domain-containing protein [Cytophagales bacterium]|nr:LysR substrate-binding domain-containing protein [Cytophagales bacterium]